MATLKVIRRRIASVKNTRKITRAMKLVSAAKLRRAQQAMVGMRPFAAKYRELLGVLIESIDAGPAHPLMRAPEEVRTVAVLVLTSDRGLCGGFNSGVLRKLNGWVAERREAGVAVQLHPLGRRAAAHARKQVGVEVHEHGEIIAATEAGGVEAVAESLQGAFLGGAVDEVYVLRNVFKNALIQEATIERLLPVQPPEQEAVGVGFVDLIYEPDQAQLLSYVLPRYVEVRVREAILESIAGEFAARMNAMSAATENATEMIGNLTLAMNRARQAAITKELMEIIGGAEAM